MAQYSTIKAKGRDRTVDPAVGQANLQPVPLLAIVKDNIDPNRTGRIRAYILDNSGADENDSQNWRTLQYMTPFFGRTDPQGSDDGYGGYKLNPSSYGMWSSPPDIGSTVVCIFVNGDMSPHNSFYIGCVPTPEALRMVPAIGANFDKEDVLFNEGESVKLGGALRVPLTNMNINDPALADTDDFLNSPKPCHSYSAAVMFQQGIIRDPIRGTISSSAQRESPSRVGWGVSTPGRPIYEGGYDDSTLPDSLKAGSTTPSNLKVISRRGGHSIVMDDGDIFGRDQLVRIRTSLGHQILMSDDGQTLMLLHANGQSYIELGKEGTVDVYSTNSVNIRTQGDLNLHADNNVNIHATKDLKIQAQNIQINTETNYSLRVGADYQASAFGKHTTKSNGPLAMEASGEASLVSSAISYVSGSKVNLNTGKPSTTPAEVSPITINAHTDTLFDKEKGYHAAPGKLTSITSRAPAHAPWAHACQGADVKVDLSADANFPPEPTAPIADANQAASSPAVPVNQGTISAMPAAGAVSESLDKDTTAAMLGTAATAAAETAADAVKQGAAVVTDAAGKAQAVVGQFALTPKQLETGGVLKAGSADLVDYLIESGTSIEDAMTNNLFTGMPGAANLNQLKVNVGAQASSLVTNLQKAQTALTSSGAITGKEAPTQIAGAVMSVANEGLGKTLTAISGLSGSGGNTSLLGGAGLDTLKSGPFKWISSGNFAAGLASLNSGFGSLTQSVQAMSKSLGLSDIISQTKGAAAAAFAAITSSFKSFKPNVPQNLKKIAEDAAKQTSENAANLVGDGGGLLESITTTASDIATATGSIVSGISRGIGDVLSGGAGGIAGAIIGAKLGDSLSDTLGNSAGTELTNAANNTLKDVGNSITNPVGAVNSILGGVSDIGSKAVSALSNPAASIASGLNKLPGGQGSVAQLVDNATGALSSTVPGVDKIKGLINSAQTSAMNGLPDSIGGVLDEAAQGLAALASVGLPAGAATQLQAAISSVGGGSAVKLPTIAVGTNNRASVSTSVDNVIGDPKIPSPKYDGKPPASTEIVPDSAEIARLKKEADDAAAAFYKFKKEVWNPLDKEKQILLKTTVKGDPKREEWNKRGPAAGRELLRLSIEARVKWADYYSARSARASNST